MTATRWIGRSLAAAIFVLLCAGVGAPATSSCEPTTFPRYGTYVPSKHLFGPALILNGGGALEGPASEWKWVHDHVLGPSAGRAGNVVVLRASDVNIYDKPFHDAGNFASVQTVLIPPCATRAQVDATAPAVDRADVVFFAGGDQANYARWKGSALIAAVRRVYARGGAVGGGSAGLAIQGAAIYDSVAADRLGNDTHTADAVAYPAEPRISFTTGFFAWPPLRSTITDTHFSVRDRFGRLVVFLARIRHDRVLGGSIIYGLGIDQGSVVLVDRTGIGTVENGAPPGNSGAYLLRSSEGAAFGRGIPFRSTVGVSHIARQGETFDLSAKTTHDPWYSVTVDGAAKPIYSRDPYRP